MGLCSCFGKLATCFCFTSKDKLCTETEIALHSREASVQAANNCPNNGPTREPWGCRNPSHTIPNDVGTKSPISDNVSSKKDNNDGERQKVEWTSGARKEVTTIKWKIQDFLALCELKELLRNETLIFTAGHSLNKPTRWCFNLQRMKTEDNIGLFLKRLPPLSFKDAISNTAGINQSDDKRGGIVAIKNNSSSSSPNGNGGVIVPAVNEQNIVANLNEKVNDEEPVYIHYECIIKRSGHGDIWIHKRTCIPNFGIDQRLGFRKLFTMEDLKAADDLSKPKVSPLLSNNSLYIDIKFTLHLKSIERTRAELSMMESFSLNWTIRYHAELLREELKRLLVNGSNSDLILIVEADNDEKTFQAHKGVLAARSPVFAAMLHSGMKETCSGIVRIKDVTAKAMQNVLCYIYSGATDEQINWSNVGEVQDLIYAADKYSLIGLRDYCDKMMFTGCEYGNAVELLYLAQMHNMKVAVKEISLFIKMNANEMFSG